MNQDYPERAVASFFWAWTRRFILFHDRRHPRDMNDAAEMKDLAADAAHAGEVNRLVALVQDWQKRVDDGQELTSTQPAPLGYDFRKVKRAK